MRRYFFQTRLWNVLLLLSIALFVSGTIVHAAPTSSAKRVKGKSSSAKGKATGRGGAGINAVLTDAPFVPPRIRRSQPSKVIVELEVSEVTLPISEGVDYTF